MSRGSPWCGRVPEELYEFDETVEERKFIVLQLLRAKRGKYKR